MSSNPHPSSPAPEVYIGAVVRKRFKSQDRHGTQTIQCFWVRVQAYEGGKLRGFLDDEPKGRGGLYWGAPVELDPSEIELIMLNS